MVKSSHKGIPEFGKFFLVQFPESRKFKSWNQGSRALESRIKLKESGIPLTIGIWNLIKVHWQRLESSTWNPDSTARSPESKTVLDFLHGARRKHWEKTGNGPRENDLRERIPHTWPPSPENYFQSILGSVSYCVVILRTPPYWSVRVVLCNCKLGG